MLHHVRHVALLVAMKAGRCEGSEKAGFHNRGSERVMKLIQEEQQQV